MMIGTIGVIGLAGSVAAIFYGLYLLKRNTQVCNFRNHVIDLCANYCSKEVNLQRYYYAFDVLYAKLPSYESMLFSLKKLKLESYYTEEEIKELTGK